MRKLQQEREKKRLEAEEEKRKAKELLDQQIKAEEEEEEIKKKKTEECSTSDCSVPVRVGSSSSNLGRFLECTTPVVSTQYFPLTNIKGWRTREPEYFPYGVGASSSLKWDRFGCSVLCSLSLWNSASRACTSRSWAKMFSSVISISSTQNIPKL